MLRRMTERHLGAIFLFLVLFLYRVYLQVITKCLATRVTKGRRGWGWIAWLPGGVSHRPFTMYKARKIWNESRDRVLPRVRYVNFVLSSFLSRYAVGSAPATRPVVRDQTKEALPPCIARIGRCYARPRKKNSADGPRRVRAVPAEKDGKRKEHWRNIDGRLELPEKRLSTVATIDF